MDGLPPIYTEAKTCGECYDKFVGSRFDNTCRACKTLQVLERIAYALEIQVGIE